MNKIKSIALASAVVLTSACSTLPNANTSGSVYSEGQALSQAFVAKGVITHIQNVQIEQGKTISSVVGGGLGAVLGGAAGSHVGGGSGQQIATLVGAVIGGSAGVMAGDKYSGRVPGGLYTVRLKNGHEFQIPQANDPQNVFSVGEVVAVSKMRMAVQGQGRFGKTNQYRDVYRITKSAQ